MNAKISIIVPVYKVEPYLRQSLDSIVNQTYRNLEIILIDDGSPDRCGEICDAYAKKDERIRVVHKQNEGLSAARNTGIELATGDWLAFVDSDDWCDLEYYEQLIKVLNQIENHDEVDIFWSGGYYRELHNQTKEKTVNAQFLYDAATNRNILLDKILTFGPPWDKLFRTEFIRNKQLLFDTVDKANEDVWFNFVTHNEARMVAGCSFIGYHWRIIPTSITRGYNPEKTKYCYRLIEKCYQEMEKYPHDVQVDKMLNKRCFAQINYIFRCNLFHPSNPKSAAEIKKELNEMKRLPYFARAIYDNDNSGLSLRRIILKYALRLPWLWPVKMLYLGKRVLTKQ